MNQGFKPIPSHLGRPLQRLFNGVKYRAIPIVFQGSPASLDRIVLAVIGRIVDQLHAQSGGLAELSHAFDELRTIASHRRAAI